MEPNIEVSEVFLDFKRIQDQRGSTLYNEVIHVLAKAGLPLGKLLYNIHTYNKNGKIRIFFLKRPEFLLIYS